MNDRNMIVGGLGIFVILVLFPLWWGWVAGNSGDPPDLTAELANTPGPCVMDSQYMRESHMDLLNRWRDEVVRGDARFFSAADGFGLEQGRERDEKSLSQTCLRCHDQTRFCDSCHEYSAVVPTCWNCHIDPRGGE